jgi:NADPH2:quinone reductase
MIQARGRDAACVLQESMMRAIHVTEFGPPDVLRLSDLPTPEPGPGEVRVKVSAAGVNPVESYIRSGTYARKPALPYTPGTDGAGVVDAVGAGVTSVAPGDRVYVAALIATRNTGTYAEALVCDAAAVHRLPASVSFAQGAAVGVPYATAWRALFQKARLQPGETVLVHGASGGVGTAAVQMARAHGATVIGTAGTKGGRELVRSEGAHHALDHGAAGYLDAVPNLTGGRGVDVVVEMLANVNLERALTVLAPGGRVVIVGSRGALEFTPRLIMAKDASVIGMTLWNTSAADALAVNAAVTAGLESGVLRPVVGKELPLASAAQAHVDVMTPGAHGKIVLLP